MDKYIFLDIDGVLATPQNIEEGMWGLVPEKQDLLELLLLKTDAKIVLSSSWRYSTVEETKTFMTKKGFRFSDKIVGVTIRAYQYIEKGIHLSIPRGVEIKQWLDTNIHSNSGKNWDRKLFGKHFTYVILDDESDMLLEQQNVFIKTDSLEGLTLTDVTKAIEILNTELNL